MEKSTLRFIVAVYSLIAVPCYVACGLHHVCMDGHMQHPPYPTVDWLTDAAWVAATIIAALLGWKSNLRFKRSILLGWVLLLVSRLVFGSGGGFFLPFELPVLVCVTLAALVGLWSPERERSDEEQKNHRRRILHLWSKALGVLSLAALVVYAGIRLRNFIRDKTAPRHEITENAIPYTREITLDPGKAAVLVLPNKKSVAIWCERPSRIELGISGTALRMEYAEQPYIPLERENIPLPSGGTTSGEYLSYIRQGSVMDRGYGRPAEYILYVDPYRISFDQKDITSSIRLVATVTRASTEEQVSPKNEVDHLVSRLQDKDADARLQAVGRLTELLDCGSIYAEPRKAFIIGQLRNLIKDPDPRLRQLVSDSLRRLGDVESILREIQPFPSGRFLDTEEIRMLGNGAKECGNPAELAPLYQHVLTFSQSDQEKLRAFAVLFFSFTDPVPEARAILIKARQDPSAAVRAAAAHALNNLYDENLHDGDPTNDTMARDQAIAMLNDPAPEVVIAALETSIHSGEHRQLPFKAVEPLLTKNHKGIRIAAISSVHTGNTAESERVLLEFTHEQDPDIRAAAAQSLYQAHSKATGDRMVELLQDAETIVRIRALQALDGGDHKGAVPAIKALLLKEKDPDVIRIANDALSRL